MNLELEWVLGFLLGPELGGWTITLSILNVSLTIVTNSSADIFFLLAIRLLSDCVSKNPGFLSISSFLVLTSSAPSFK